MIISTDGACKRNGTPQCSSAGVAWVVKDNGEMYFKATYESSGSTSQRGEINGLINALTIAYDETHGTDEIIVIVTDSEYICNTVRLGWSFKWERNGWMGAQGPAKNADLWAKANALLRRLNANDEDRVIMSWTKGHLMSYTAANAKRAMAEDSSGVELYSRILSIANRPSDHDRIISDYQANLRDHQEIVVTDAEECITRVTMNVMADCLAGYVVQSMENVAL